MTIDHAPPLYANSRVFNAGAYEMNDVYGFISGALGPAPAGDRDAASLNIAADEVFANVMSYAYETSVTRADKWVALEIRVEGETVTMIFTDGGRPFDPTGAPAPDISLSASEREIGGLGIHLVRSLMDDMEYLRRDGKNVLTVRKTLEKR